MELNEKMRLTYFLLKLFPIIFLQNTLKTQLKFENCYNFIE